MQHDGFIVFIEYRIIGSLAKNIGSLNYKSKISSFSNKKHDQCCHLHIKIHDFFVVVYRSSCSNKWDIGTDKIHASKRNSLLLL